MQLPKTVNCTQCSDVMNLRDGQYGPFYSHKTPDGYHNAKPKDLFPGESFEVSEYGSHMTNPKTSAPQRREKTDTDWDGIARGKTRSLMIAAVIQHDGLQVALASLPSIEKAVDYAMEGIKSNSSVPADTDEF